jgi:arsenite-transporting ATPase
MMISMKLGKLGRKERDTQYFMFSGKGGVGKTSIAAATAVRMAGQGKKVLLISTDPAHSLSDSFEKKVGGDIVKLQKNLFAVEIDPKKAMSEYKEKFMAGIDKFEKLQGLGLGDSFDMVGMAPGIDEIAALDKFLQYLQSRDYDAVIFDTAPTGHTLRFLSLPDVLDSWVGKMIMIRMRFDGMAKMVRKILPFSNDDGEKGDMGLEQLNAMKARVEEAKRTLSDPARTSYNIVMIPEEMSILESERSMEFLKQYRIPVKSVFVNKIIPQNPRCPFCTEKRKQQLERLKEIRKKFAKLDIREIPLSKHEIKGIGKLEKLGKEFL